MIVRLVKILKGNKFNIDNDISSWHIFRLLLIGGFKLFRGYLCFYKLNKRILLGKNATILSRDKIYFNGRDIHIDKECHIDAMSKNGIIFGDKVSIQKRVIIECTGSLQKLGVGLVLGDNVGIGCCSLLGCAGGIEIGDDTIIGNFVSFHSENHNFNNLELPIRLQGVNHQGIKVGRNCWIGAKATILDGAEIMDGCIIAASALVIAGKYAENGIYGGVPAKLIKFRI